MLTGTGNATIYGRFLRPCARSNMSFSPRVAAACGLLAGLISGCASGNSALRDPATELPRNPNVVTAEDLDRTANESIERTLAAKVPGLYISHTADGSIAIRIRGN